MTRFRIWFSVNEAYCVDVEAEDIEGAMDQVYENPPTNQRDTYVDTTVEIYDWEAVDG